MIVQSILKSKAADKKHPQLVTSTPAATIADIARLLAANNIGAVVLTGPDQRVAGILSERDIVRHIAKSGAAALAMSASAVMTRTVTTCTATDSVDHVMAMMTRGRFRHMPVIGTDGRLTGLISIGDVVKFHVEDVEQEASALRHYITQPH